MMQQARVPVTINLNGPSGNLPVQADMTPQSIANMRRYSINTGGGLSHQTKNFSIGPVRPSYQ